MCKSTVLVLLLPIWNQTPPLFPLRTRVFKDSIPRAPLLLASGWDCQLTLGPSFPGGLGVVRLLGCC